MRTIELRKIVGLENDQDWPKKLTFTTDPTKMSFTTISDLSQSLAGLGYIPTATVQNPDGTVQAVFVRQEGAKTDPESLLIRCREAFRKEAEKEGTGLLSTTWQLLDEIQAWLEP